MASGSVCSRTKKWRTGGSWSSRLSPTSTGTSCPTAGAAENVPVSNAMKAIRENRISRKLSVEQAGERRPKRCCKDANTVLKRRQYGAEMLLKRPEMLLKYCQNGLIYGNSIGYNMNIRCFIPIAAFLKIFIRPSFCTEPDPTFLLLFYRPPPF